MKTSQFFAASIVVAAAVAAQEVKKPAHVMVTPGEVQWANGPGSLPPGAQFAIVEGDLASPALFTLRLRFPAGYSVPAHWHPVDEHVTVLSGTLHMGMGDKLDAGQTRALPPGSFVVMPAKANHFGFAKEETVLQIHAMGPWAITYVNPADDPRKK